MQNDFDYSEVRPGIASVKERTTSITTKIRNQEPYATISKTGYPNDVAIEGNVYISTNIHTTKIAIARTIPMIFLFFDNPEDICTPFVKPRDDYCILS
jgi:hypothetical protein